MAKTAGCLPMCISPSILVLEPHNFSGVCGHLEEERHFPASLVAR